MNDLKDFLISDEARLVYIIALVISITYIVFYYFRKTKQKRLQKQNTIELKKIVNNASKKSKKISSDSSTLVVSDNKTFINEEEKCIVKETIEKVKNMEEIVIKEKEISPPVIDNIVDEKVKVQEEIKQENTINVIDEKISDIVSETKIVEETTKKSNVTDNKIKADKMDAILNKLYQASVGNIKEKDNDEEITYINNVPNEEEAKKELEEVTRKLEQDEENKNIELTEFEKMQEDTAIISLDELMKKAGEMYSYNEEVQYKDEGNEPISLADLDNRKKSVIEVREEKVDEVVTIDDFNITITPVEEEVKTPFVQEENKKFVPSSVISPVYGMNGDINKNTDLELENTANYEKLDEEIRKTNEFMATLKELQKKLD